MKILKAKIKKTSPYYNKGLNQKGKPVWLSITGFNPIGDKNYRIKAIKSIKHGFAEYQEIWVPPADITMKQFEDGQLTMDIFSPQEVEQNKYNPRYFNQRRFEIITKNEKQYMYAPDIETIEKVLKHHSIYEAEVKQVPRLKKGEIEGA